MASLPSATESSCRVSSVEGAPPTRFAMAVFTKAVVATVLELLSALAVGKDVEPVTVRDVALAVAMVTAPVNVLSAVMVCVVLVVSRFVGFPLI